MREFSFVPIVEGHGEVFAVPILPRRLGERFHPTVSIHVLPPAEKLDGPGAILILLDTEGGCPAHLGPRLLERARARRPDRTIRVALAHHEYEAWFLAAAESLQGRRGLSADLRPPQDPETVQGAKEWLRRNMVGSRTYAETADQPALTALFDLDLARRCSSFDRLCRLFQELLTARE